MAPTIVDSVVQAIHRPNKRPRGLWKARHPAAAYLPPSSPGLAHSPHDSDTPSDLYDEDDDEDDDAHSHSSKRQRRESQDSLQYCFLPGGKFSSPIPPSPKPEGDATNTRLTHKMNETTSTAQRGKSEKLTCDYDDWVDLKEMFSGAAEQYERDDAVGASCLLRAVIHECHRFLEYYNDPSVLFVAPPAARHTDSSPETLTPPDERLYRDWGPDQGTRIASRRQSRSVDRTTKYTELPTAFHAILGITLFLFGNLIAQESSLALSGEPDAPAAYWLSALDVFETGENLPSKIDGRSGDAEDWRMAIVWGRTLVCLADEKITRTHRAANPVASSSSETRMAVDDPKWSIESPFHAIAARRPPITRRMSLSNYTANDLLTLAVDQFSRGIFHMPHPQYTHSHSTIFSRSTQPQTALPQTLTPASPDSLAFSRPKELFTIASEVLGVAERLTEPDERRTWAAWADSVFNQMKMEADMDAWRTQITGARGRCWLVAGSARVDEIEDALERGEMEVLMSNDAEEAREGLTMAVSFFDRALGSASSAPPETDLQDIRSLFAEALLSLANLTQDEVKREELYSRALAEGGETVALALNQDSETTSYDDQVVYMDES